MTVITGQNYLQVEINPWISQIALFMQEIVNLSSEFLSLAIECRLLILELKKSEYLSKSVLCTHLVCLTLCTEQRI